MSILFILVLLIKNGIFRKGILLAFAEDSCDSHENCTFHQVCCKGTSYPWWVNKTSEDVFHCRKPLYRHSIFDESCYGYSCTRSSDCGFLKDGDRLCCMENECRLCEQCVKSIGCVYPLACCVVEWNEERMFCIESCLEEIQICHEGSDCAQSECCLSNRCSNCSDGLGCTDHWDCSATLYCCDALNTYGNRSCKSSCVAESCAVDNDCVYPEYCERNQCRLPGKSCSNGICEKDKTQWCNSDADCIISDGPEHKCCIDTWQSTDHCSTLNRCFLPVDSKPRSKTERFPTWLFAGFGGFLLLVLVSAIGFYFRRKKRQRSNRNNVPDTACSGNSRERQRNVSRDTPLGNGEQNIFLAPYPITSNLLGSHGNADCIPNVPPPPYSFDDEIVSPDRYNDAPPRYQLTQF